MCVCVLGFNSGNKRKHAVNSYLLLVVLGLAVFLYVFFLMVTIICNKNLNLNRMKPVKHRSGSYFATK